MTAINCYALKDRAVMMTDGAFYDDQGVVYGVEKKAVSITGMSAVAAMRGDLELTRKILLGLPTYGTFDNLRALIEADMKEWLKDYGDFLSADPWWSFDISIVGWSEAEQRSKILTLEFDGELEVERVEDFTLRHWPLDVAREYLAALECLPGRDFGLHNFDPRFHGVEVMQAQRLRKMSIDDGGDELNIVGGNILLSEAGPQGVTQKVIHEWPDVIGETIQPGSFAHAVEAGRRRRATWIKNRPAEGVDLSKLNRQQRRALLKRSGGRAA